jgi:hypothetical protein
MLIPKSGRIGAMLSAVTMLIGIGLLLPPAASFDEFRVALPVPVAAGDQHSLVLKEDGTVNAWGWNYYGQLGDGTRTYTFSGDSVVRTPVQVIGLPSLIINYFNEYGRPYTNEEYGFWYNRDERQWYQGTKSTGQIIPIALPPWKEQNAP